MKIINIGTDIEEVSRFENLDTKVLNRLFTDEELKYSGAKKNKAEHLAVRYCAKEAVFKALPFDKIAFKKIQVLNTNSGAPIVEVKDKRAEGLEFKISLSHTRVFAQAVVLVYKK